jgi:DNA segregation ATPase FtsK/SpoIIIE, S-DNA-T family
MFFSDKSADPRVAKNPLPPKIAALLRESWWLAFLALALYLLLILYTYRKSDPGWSHSVADAQIGNAGGVVGAYISDLMLSAFGVSAYWWVVLCGALVWWGFRRIEKVGDTDRRSYAVALAGFAVVLISSCGIEAVRLHSLNAALPLAAGGVIGGLVGNGMSAAFGFTGGTLILLMAFAAGLSLFSGVSWLVVIERLGTWLENGYVYAVGKWQERKDRRVGEQAVIRRDEVVEVSKKKLEIHQPVRIEPPAVDIPTRCCRRCTCSTRLKRTSRCCLRKPWNSPRA